MANYDSTKLIVQMKALARTESLPIDSSEIWESLEAAQAYAKQANAYGGQTIKALVNGKYKTYTLQPTEDGYTLEESGVKPGDLKQYVKVVDELPQSGQEQGILYICTKDSTGYIWSGKGWQVVFKEISTEFDQFKDKVTQLEKDLDTKAPLNNPVFTGKVMVGEEEVAVKSYVEGLIANITTGAPGIVDNKNPLPSEGYKAGQTWRVASAGTYAGNKCEVGDLIICIKSHNADSASDADFMAVQANIDGAVTSTATTSTVGDIVVFDATTGKVIKSSGVNISSLNNAIAKAHTHANKEILDTYNKDQTALLATAKAEAQGLVDTLKETVDGKADKATTLKGYGITDTYNQSEIDGKLDTITQNLNTKVDGATVDEKISNSEQKITGAYTKAIGDKIGDIPESDTVKSYVDRVAGTGSADVGEQIKLAKQEAIAQSKSYTDSCLTVIEF